MFFEFFVYGVFILDVVSAKEEGRSLETNRHYGGYCYQEYLSKLGLGHVVRESHKFFNLESLSS